MQQQVTFYDSATDETWTETIEVPDPEPVAPAVTLEVDPAALDAALTKGMNAGTLAQNRQAWAELGKALNP